MRIDKKQREELLGAFIWGVVGLLIMLLVGCSTVKYVPVETVRHDSIRVVTVKVDSVYVSDSVYTLIKGDTVMRDRYKYIYKYMFRTDTCYIEKTDSIQVPYPVERSLTRWQRAKLELGGWAFGWMLFALLIVGWLVYKKQNK